MVEYIIDCWIFKGFVIRKVVCFCVISWLSLNRSER